MSTSDGSTPATASASRAAWTARPHDPPTSSPSSYRSTPSSGCVDGRPSSEAGHVVGRRPPGSASPRSTSASAWLASRSAAITAMTTMTRPPEGALPPNYAAAAFDDAAQDDHPAECALELARAVFRIDFRRCDDFDVVAVQLHGHL